MNLKSILKSLVVVLLMVQSITVMAQNQVTISGRVLDDADLTLPGVNIRVKGKVVGTITDADGNFNLTVNQDPPLTLIFSYVGYTTQEIEINQVDLGDEFAFGFCHQSNLFNRVHFVISNKQDV